MADWIDYQQKLRSTRDDGKLIEADAIDGELPGAIQNASRLDNIDDTILDLHPGPPGSGWAAATNDSEGGLALADTAAAVTLTTARGVTTWARNLVGNLNRKYLLARLPAGFDARQARVYVRMEAGSGLSDYTYTVSALHLLGASSDGNWNLYGLRGSFSAAADEITLQLTGTGTHVGQSRYAGIFDGSFSDRVRSELDGLVDKGAFETLVGPVTVTSSADRAQWSWPSAGGAISPVIDMGRALTDDDADKLLLIELSYDATTDTQYTFMCTVRQYLATVLDNSANLNGMAHVGMARRPEDSTAFSAISLRNVFLTRATAGSVANRGVRLFINDNDAETIATSVTYRISLLSTGAAANFLTPLGSKAVGGSEGAANQWLDTGIPRPAVIDDDEVWAFKIEGSVEGLRFFHAKPLGDVANADRVAAGAAITVNGLTAPATIEYYDGSEVAFGVIDTDNIGVAFESIGLARGRTLHFYRVGQLDPSSAQKLIDSNEVRETHALGNQHGYSEETWFGSPGEGAELFMTGPELSDSALLERIADGIYRAKVDGVNVTWRTGAISGNEVGAHKTVSFFLDSADSPSGPVYSHDNGYPGFDDATAHAGFTLRTTRPLRKGEYIGVHVSTIGVYFGAANAFTGAEIDASVSLPDLLGRLADLVVSPAPNTIYVSSFARPAGDGSPGAPYRTLDEISGHDLDTIRCVDYSIFTLAGDVTLDAKHIDMPGAKITIGDGHDLTLSSVSEIEAREISGDGRLLIESSRGTRTRISADLLDVRPGISGTATAYVDLDVKRDGARFWAPPYGTAEAGLTAFNKFNFTGQGAGKVYAPQDQRIATPPRSLMTLEGVGHSIPRGPICTDSQQPTTPGSAPWNFNIASGRYLVTIKGVKTSPTNQLTLRVRSLSMDPSHVGFVEEWDIDLPMGDWAPTAGATDKYALIWHGNQFYVLYQDQRSSGSKVAGGNIVMRRWVATYGDFIPSTRSYGKPAFTNDATLGEQTRSTGEHWDAMISESAGRDNPVLQMRDAAIVTMGSTAVPRLWVLIDIPTDTEAAAIHTRFLAGGTPAPSNQDSSVSAGQVLVHVDISTKVTTTTAAFTNTTRYVFSSKAYITNYTRFPHRLWWYDFRPSTGDSSHTLDAASNPVSLTPFYTQLWGQGDDADDGGLLFYGAHDGKLGAFVTTALHNNAAHLQRRSGDFDGYLSHYGFFHHPDIQVALSGHSSKLYVLDGVSRRIWGVTPPQIMRGYARGYAALNPAIGSKSDLLGSDVSSSEFSVDGRAKITTAASLEHNIADLGGAVDYHHVKAVRIVAGLYIGDVLTFHEMPVLDAEQLRPLLKDDFEDASASNTDKLLFAQQYNVLVQRTASDPLELVTGAIPWDANYNAQVAVIPLLDDDGRLARLALVPMHFSGTGGSVPGPGTGPSVRLTRFVVEV